MNEECEFCFYYNGDIDTCCLTDKENMPYNCPCKNDLIEV